MRIVVKRKTTSTSMPTLLAGEPMVWKDRLLIGSIGTRDGGKASIGSPITPFGVPRIEEEIVPAKVKLSDDSARLFIITDPTLNTYTDGDQIIFKLPESVSSTGAAVKVNDMSYVPIVYSTGELATNLLTDSWLTVIYNNDLSVNINISGNQYITGVWQILSVYKEIPDMPVIPEPFSGDYNDLINTPTIPDPQVNSDWNAVSGVAKILNKPTIPEYITDLSDVTVSAPQSNDVLKWNGSAWVNSPVQSDSLFICTMTSQTVEGVKTWSCDKTWAQILAADAAGKTVLLTDNVDSYMHPVVINDTAGIFSTGYNTSVDGHEMFIMVTFMYGDSTWSQSVIYGYVFTDTEKAKVSYLPIGTGSSGQVLTSVGSGQAQWSTLSIPSAINDLSDVTVSSPQTNEVLKWNGSAWVNAAAPSGGGGIFLCTMTEVESEGGTAWSCNKTWAQIQAAYSAGMVVCLTDGEGIYSPIVIQASGGSFSACLAGGDPVNNSTMVGVGTFNYDASTDTWTSVTFNSAQVLPADAYKLSWLPLSSGNTGQVLTSTGLNTAAQWATITAPNDSTITIQKNGTDVDTFTLNQSTDKSINITVPTSASDVGALPSSTKYGASITTSMDSSTYVLSTTLKDQDGNTLGTVQTVDLPLETMVVSGSYDSTNKKVVLTLKNGSTVDFSVADLVSGLQTEITSSNKLSADLISDGTTNKAYTATEKTKLSGIETGAQVNVKPDWNAASGAAAEILNKPTIPTVNNATLTIKRNGTSLGTFTANSSTNTEVDISVPSAPGTLNTTATTAQSTNSSEALSGSVTLHKVAKTGTYSDLIGTPTIPTVNNATLTIQKNGTTINTFTANASSNVTANISVREVPVVTSSDNGKVLMVNSSGEWEAQELRTNVFYTGSAVPSNSMGDNGDLYLQINE